MRAWAVAESSGVCSTSGWSAAGDGPNCTYVGDRAWRGAHVMVGSCAKNVRKALEEHTAAWVTSLLDLLEAGGIAGGGRGGGALVFEDQQRAGDQSVADRDALRAWVARDARVRLLLAAPLRYPAWSRTQRIALCRNMLLHEAVASLPPRGFLVALDIDCRGPPVAQVVGALSSMLASPRWDVLTANSRAPTPYYDRWAMRSATLGLDYDCWFDKARTRTRGSCPDWAMDIDPAAAPFAVDSAFNGLGLYRAAALRAGGAAGCRYRGTKNSYLCEHVPFHLCLRGANFSIGVLPSLTNDCGAGPLSKQPRRVRLLANGTLQVLAEGKPVQAGLSALSALRKEGFVDGAEYSSYRMRILEAAAGSRRPLTAMGERRDRRS